MFELRGRDALELRISKKMNRDEVAREVGCSVGVIGLWESRDRIAITHGKARRLATALGCDLGEMGSLIPPVPQDERPPAGPIDPRRHLSNASRDAGRYTGDRPRNRSGTARRRVVRQSPGEGGL